MFGYHIQDLNHIYLSEMDKPEIVLIDSMANVLERIDFGKTSEGLQLHGAWSISHSYKPFWVIDHKMYIVARGNRFAERNPVTVTIDLETKAVDELPFQYPKFPVFSDAPASVEDYLSCYYDGHNFVYSFHNDENIYVTLPDHQTVRSIPVKSRYIPEVIFSESIKTGNLMNTFLEVPTYGNLIYDPYREVYYRFTYPECKLDNGENFIDIYLYGRKTFSIIILDREFNILGETLFPDFTYSAPATFVREDGLYISASHYKNPDYSDDVLKFVRFELVKE
jgi:hypothetical protein